MYQIFVWFIFSTRLFDFFKELYMYNWGWKVEHIYDKYKGRVPKGPKVLNN